MIRENKKIKWSWEFSATSQNEYLIEIDIPINNKLFQNIFIKSVEILKRKNVNVKTSDISKVEEF
jgi:hypothetical protein